MTSIKNILFLIINKVVKIIKAFKILPSIINNTVVSIGPIIKRVFYTFFTDKTCQQFSLILLSNPVVVVPEHNKKADRQRERHFGHTMVAAFPPLRN